ncbi:EamA family transporter, partial [Leuconostoc mesenteroides]|uniref:GRP family sugar transporter n=1 Tax=Leuconostoc mesenteroides TaxID=1245 RepID=UPI001CC02CF9
MQGILFALVPIFAWGSIGLVANKFGGDANQQTLGMTLGAFIFALIVFLFRMPTLTWQIFIIGFIGGLLWAIGQFGQFNSMKYMGVSVASPLSSGSQLVIGGLLGVFAFHEWTRQIQFILGFIAMAVLIVGFYFSAKRDPENAVVEEGRNYTKGLTALTYSTLGYVLYVILFNNLAALWFNVHFDTLTIILPMSVGMIFGALVMGRFKIKMEKYVYQNMITGVMFGVGNIFM